MPMSPRRPEPLRTPLSRQEPRKYDLRDILYNLLLLSLSVLVIVLAYAFASRTFFSPPVESTRAVTGDDAGPIQVDVLNGCGSAGAGTAFTGFLRARGFDVVEIRNYKSFDVTESLVIDRTGNRANAERVAYALGIRSDHVIQQINENYFVDVSVIIGRDHGSLKPPEEGSAQ
jgi:hypothetical protein